MSMFDNLKCELLLPDLPQEVFDRWKDKIEDKNTSSDIVFQTKDTPNQSMSLYNIDSTGQIYLQKVEGYWEEPKINTEDSDNVESFSSFLNTIGKYHETSRTWEAIEFNGSINFYESYDHPDKPTYGDELYDNEDDRFRYVVGWIEYQVQLVNGKVHGDVILISHELPIQYTDDELAARKERWQSERKDMESKFKKNRKEYPSPEQKLIDQIYNATTEAVKFELHEREWHAIAILRLIKDYRDKIDKWYTDEN